MDYSNAERRDTDQEAAIEDLRERYARGGISIEEFRRLMGQLMVTTDAAERQAILDSLPPDTAPRYDRTTPPQRGSSYQRSRGDASSIRAFFGEVDRSRSLWELGPDTEVSAVFGEVRLDIRMAKLSKGETVLRLHALFGEIRVLVPQGLRISVEGIVQFGEVRTPGHTIGGIIMQDTFTLGNEATSENSLHIEAKATFGEIRIISV